MIRLILAVLAVATFTAYAEVIKEPACERLLECVRKVRTENEKCFARHTNKTAGPCVNEALFSKLNILLDKRARQFETCVHAKLETSGEKNTTKEVTSARKKRKCEQLMQKNVEDIFGENYSNSTLKRPKRNSCFKETRKLRSHCSHLARCCSVTKPCREEIKVDGEIHELREEARKLAHKCRKEKRRSRKGHKHRKPLGLTKKHLKHSKNDKKAEKAEAKKTAKE